MWLNENLDKFIFNLSQKKSRNTMEAYKRSLDIFYNFTGNVEMGSITESLINVEFLEYLKKNNKSLHYISIILQHIRIFLSFLNSVNIETFEPSLIKDREIKNSIEDYSNRYKGEILSRDEMNRMLNYWKNTEISNSPRGIRNQVLIELLINTGLFTSELNNILRENIDLNKRLLKINYYSGKKSYKNRNLKLNLSAAYWVERYFEMRGDNSQCLMVGFNNRDDFIVKSWPLTNKSMEEIVRKTGKESIDKKVTPMVIRNSLINEKINDGICRYDMNKYFGYNQNTNRIYALKYGEDKKTAKNCLNCGNEFETLFKKKQKYCSKKCSYLYLHKPD